MKRHNNSLAISLAFSVLAVGLMAMPAMAWWVDSGEQNPTSTNMGSGTSCSRTYWYCWDHLASCEGRNFYATWNHGFSWSGRGWYHEDFYLPGYYSGSASYALIRAINQSGGDNGNTWRDRSSCDRGCEWINLYEQAVDNVGNYNGVRIDANESTDTCKACGYAITMVGQVRGYGDRYSYLNRWVIIGPWSSTAITDTNGLDEANLYLYPYVDTTHGSTIAAGLWGGKVPSAYYPGDMNNAYSINFGTKWSQTANQAAYALAWIYSPSGAAPKFDIGSDDGERCWVNGTMITDVNTNRGLTRDQDVTSSISLPAGWSRVVLKVQQGPSGGGWEGTVSLRNGGDNRQNEPSVSYQSDRYGGYSIYNEQDGWYPTLTLANADGVASPGLAKAIYTNDTTVTASGTAAGNTIPLWKVMEYQWGYGLSDDTNYAEVTSSGTSWSHSQSNVTGHRRFHFFGVSKSGRTSGQASGSSGGWTYDNSGHANYFDMYVDNVSPQAPSFSNATVTSTSQIDLNWTLPLDEGVGIAAGSDESSNSTKGGTNHYRRGDVGVQVRRNGTAIYGWGTETSTSDTGLTPNTSYTYDIAARDNSGGSRGSWNNTTSYVSTTSKYTLQNVPTTPTISNVTATGLTVETTGPVNLTAGNSGVVFNRNGSDLAKIQVLSMVEDALTANTQYTYTATAYNGDNVATATSASASAYTLIEAVDNLVLANVSQNSVDVSASNVPSNLTAGSSGLKFENVTATTDSGWQQDNTAWSSTGLTPNTAYSFAGLSRNGDGVETTAANGAIYTLAGAPSAGDNVVCDKTAGTVVYGPGDTFTFSNPAEFGDGTHGGSAFKVAGFRYAWGLDASYTFTGSESTWNSSDLVLTPTVGQAGSYYAHFQSINADGVATETTLTVGPFVYEEAPLAVTVDQQSTQRDPTNVLPVWFDVVFSREVADFADGDVTWTGTAADITYTIAGSGTTYTIEVTAVGTPGTLVPTLAAGVAHDAGNRPNEASTSTDGSVLYTTAPNLTVEGWSTVRTHGTAGEFTLALPASGTPGAEPRRGGIQKIVVTFSEAAVPTDGTLDANDVTVTDNLSNTYTPVSIALVEGGVKLELGFTANQLPNKRRYTIDVTDKFDTLATQLPFAGDGDVDVRSLLGDANGDGEVNLIDLAAVKAGNGSVLSDGTANLDLNTDGVIDLIDAALSRAKAGQTAP